MKNAISERVTTIAGLRTIVRVAVGSIVPEPEAGLDSKQRQVNRMETEKYLV